MVSDKYISATFLAVTCAVATLLATAATASAQGLDLTVFTGLAYPLYDERLTLTPGGPSIPGVDVTVADPLVLRGDGGAVVGAAVAYEFQRGLVGIEGRMDSIGAGIDFSGARYEVRGTSFPFQGISASIDASPGRFDADRVNVLSLNARIRTRGRVGVIASGGISYLPDITVSGSVPLSVAAPELPSLGLNTGLTLRATPEQSGHRIGINGGAGVRVGGRVALVAEVRGFYFRDYGLRFGTTEGPPLIDELLAGADAVSFTPVFVNAQAGVTFRF
jgi:hypothetical protein